MPAATLPPDLEHRYADVNGIRIAKGVRTIKASTLLIWGEADQFLGKELTYGTAEFVKNLRIEYLPEISHWVQQEAPDAVNRLLLTHLESARRGG